MSRRRRGWERGGTDAGDWCEILLRGGLGALAKPLDVAVDDHADGQPEEGFADVVASFPADA
ncbi:hypothetical protein ADL30_02115 [Streptomyces sp. NRRL S-1521]|nr:hypothetical protein ADL30_02115 [Streptomyces sp. NRRL S-1521]